MNTEGFRSMVPSACRTDPTAVERRDLPSDCCFPSKLVISGREGNLPGSRCLATTKRSTKRSAESTPRVPCRAAAGFFNGCGEQGGRAWEGQGGSGRDSTQARRAVRRWAIRGSQQAACKGIQSVRTPHLEEAYDSLNHGLCSESPALAGPQSVCHNFAPWESRHGRGVIKELSES